MHGHVCVFVCAWIYTLHTLSMLCTDTYVRRYADLHRSLFFPLPEGQACIFGGASPIPFLPPPALLCQFLQNAPCGRRQLGKSQGSHGECLSEHSDRGLSRFPDCCIPPKTDQAPIARLHCGGQAQQLTPRKPIMVMGSRPPQFSRKGGRSRARVRAHVDARRRPRAGAVIAIVAAAPQHPLAQRSRSRVHVVDSWIQDCTPLPKMESCRLLRALQVQEADERAGQDTDGVTRMRVLPRSWLWHS